MRVQDWLEGVAGADAPIPPFARVPLLPADHLPVHQEIRLARRAVTGFTDDSGRRFCARRHPSSRDPGQVTCLILHHMVLAALSFREAG